MTDHIDTAQERRRLVGNEAVLHRIPSYLDALDAERARAERAEAERDEWKDEYQAVRLLLHRYKDAATNRQAERDQALARLAAVKRVTKCARCGSDGGFGCYECIPPADAEAALQRGVDAAWNEAVEACARACALMPDALPASPRMAFEAGLAACEAHILTLKRPEASHD